MSAAKHIWHTVREHTTHAAIAGAVAVLTGFAPEQWMERALHALHIPDSIRTAFDFRIGLVLVGVAIIVIDVVVRSHRKDKQSAANAAKPGDDVFGDRPAFAVLPFSNMSGDPAQEYFADGIAEDLITAISNWCWFPVIARNSSFAYKGRSIDVKQVGQELKARYILEGSVQKAERRVRVNAQLVDAQTGHHLWAGKYDRDIDDLFAIQDEITTSIAAAVEPELAQSEEKRAVQAPKNLAAYDLVQRGNWHHNKFTAADAEEAQLLYNEAIRIDPDYAPAYAALAYTTYWATQMRWNKEPNGLERARELALKATVLDPKDARAHMYLGQTSLFLRRHDDALAETRRAIELNPSLAHAYSVLGYTLNAIGEFEEAIKVVNYSLRLRPNDRTLARCLPAVSIAHYELGDFEKAESVARQAVKINPIYWHGHQMLAASLGQLNRTREAAQEIDYIRSRDPDISLQGYSGRLPFRNPAHNEKIADGLTKAGWNTWNPSAASSPPGASSSTGTPAQ